MSREVPEVLRNDSRPAPAPVIWLTGLSSAGKTTLAERLRVMLSQRQSVEILDGDTVRLHRHELLGFSKADRDANIRQIAATARRLSEAGVTVIVAAISPYREARAGARQQIHRFVEVYVNAPLHVCEQRDVKNLYRQARAGQIHQMTGIDDPYEPPLHPDVECRTDCESIDTCATRIVDFLLADPSSNH